ncbi:MAG TPA: DUF1854 domain-containing protein [Fimbriimonas sp.]|nr:DUF1854 domain-containing protein [Fimbriimonas sp.]
MVLMGTSTYLQSSDVKLTKAVDSVFITCSIAGTVHENVHLLRAFPLSSPNEYISVRDKEDKELGVIEKLEGMDPDSRKVADEELTRRYFTPAITKIKALKNDASMWWFDVETSRGPSDFYVRNWRDNAHELTPGRWQITSVDGGRYEILNLDELDDRSQILIEQLL